RGNGLHRGTKTMRPAQYLAVGRSPGASLVLARVARRAQNPLFVRLFQIPDESSLVALRIVDEAGKPRQPLHLEPVVDDVDGCSLLADEEDPFAARDIVGDEVGDRLGLPGAGWSLDDETASLTGTGDRAGLRRIGGHHIETLFDRKRRLLRIDGSG